MAKLINIEKLAKKIKLLILDVDGVLTDGSLYFGDNGEEFKRFNALDGYGIKTIIEYGIEVAIISSRESKSVAFRAKNLNIKYCYQGQKDKNIALKKLLKILQITTDEIAYIGDDILDLPILTKIALPIAVNNAHHVVKKYALITTKNNGGNGAVREICDFLMLNQQKYQCNIDKYLKY